MLNESENITIADIIKLFIMGPFVELPSWASTKSKICKQKTISIMLQLVPNLTK